MLVEDGKMRETDVVDTEQLLRLIQSIPQSRTIQANDGRAISIYQSSAYR